MILDRLCELNRVGHLSPDAAVILTLWGQDASRASVRRTLTLSGRGASNASHRPAEACCWTAASTDHARLPKAHACSRSPCRNASRSSNAAGEVGDPNPSHPIRGIFLPCCASAASEWASTPTIDPIRNARRFISWLACLSLLERPPVRLRCLRDRPTDGIVTLLPDRSAANAAVTSRGERMRASGLVNRVVRPPSGQVHET